MALVALNSSIVSYRTVQSEIGKRSIKFKGSKLWNELPTDVKEIKSHSYFKFKIKTTYYIR